MRACSWTPPGYSVPAVWQCRPALRPLHGALNPPLILTPALPCLRCHGCPLLTGPVRPFVSVDVCPWDVAELPEWQEALRRACEQWQADAAEALAQARVACAGRLRGQAQRVSFTHAPQQIRPAACCMWLWVPTSPPTTHPAVFLYQPTHRVGPRRATWRTWPRSASSTCGEVRGCCHPSAEWDPFHG